jgi:hypothetical protein
MAPLRALVVHQSAGHVLKRVSEALLLVVVIIEVMGAAKDACGTEPKLGTSVIIREVSKLKTMYNAAAFIVPGYNHVMCQISHLCCAMSKMRFIEGLSKLWEWA